MNHIGSPLQFPECTAAVRSVQSESCRLCCRAADGELCLWRTDQFWIWTWCNCDVTALDGGVSIATAAEAHGYCSAFHIPQTKLWFIICEQNTNPQQRLLNFTSCWQTDLGAVCVHRHFTAEWGRSSDHWFTISSPSVLPAVRSLYVSPHADIERTASSNSQVSAWRQNQAVPAVMLLFRLDFNRSLHNMFRPTVLTLKMTQQLHKSIDDLLKFTINFPLCASSAAAWVLIFETKWCLEQKIQSSQFS